MQRFYADPRHTFTWPNGAVGYRPSIGFSDCLGPYAKVRNCPIDGTDVRLTCYAQGYADTFFSVPAATRYRGHRVSGFFTIDGNNIKFVPHDRHRHLFETRAALAAEPGLKAHNLGVQL